MKTLSLALLTMLAMLMLGCGSTPRPESPAPEKTEFQKRRDILIAKRNARYVAYKQQRAQAYGEYKRSLTSLYETHQLIKLAHGSKTYNTKYKPVISAARAKVKSHYNQRLQVLENWYFSNS